MKLLLLNPARAKISRPWLQKWIRAIEKSIRKKHRGLGSRELVLVFVDNEEMRRLNRTYREKDYATDVLSFASADPDAVGELVLCWPVIEEQAKRTGLGSRGELGYMIIHGVLHLLGHDHETLKEERAMFKLQDKIYADLRERVGLR